MTGVKTYRFKTDRRAGFLPSRSSPPSFGTANSTGTMRSRLIIVDGYDSRRETPGTRQSRRDIHSMTALMLGLYQSLTLIRRKFINIGIWGLNENGDVLGYLWKSCSRMILG